MVARGIRCGPPYPTGFSISKIAVQDPWLGRSSQSNARLAQATDSGYQYHGLMGDYAATTLLQPRLRKVVAGARARQREGVSIRVPRSLVIARGGLISWRIAQYFEKPTAVLTSNRVLVDDSIGPGSPTNLVLGR